MIEKQEISFLVDKQELKLLNEIIIVSEEIEDGICRAKQEGDNYRIKFSYDDLDELLGFIAAEANHERSVKRQEKLDNLYDKLKGLLELSNLVETHGKTKAFKKKGPQIKSKVYVFDVWIAEEDATHKPLRKIAIAGNKNLYTFAKAITQAFRFYFDHPFGFYDNLVNPANATRGYELFVDIGEEPLKEGFKGVKKVKVGEAFANTGDKMFFLFDYGDEWHFIVEFKEIRDALEGESLPRVLESIGEAPPQYPSCEEDEVDGGS